MNFLRNEKMIISTPEEELNNLMDFRKEILHWLDFWKLETPPSQIFIFRNWLQNSGLRIEMYRKEITWDIEQYCEDTIIYPKIEALRKDLCQSITKFQIIRREWEKRKQKQKQKQKHTTIRPFILDYLHTCLRFTSALLETLQLSNPENECSDPMERLADCFMLNMK